jgi:hypothetical protein
VIDVYFQLSMVLVTAILLVKAPLLLALGVGLRHVTSRAG